MKIEFNKIIMLIVWTMLFTACRKMDTNHREFVIPGGIIYPEKATEPLIYPGHNRVKISWLKGSDPSVARAKIFWDNYSDSVEVNTLSFGDTISVTIDNLPEKSYSFVIRTYDAKGNVSVPVELLGSVYGVNYQTSLLNRSVVIAEINSENEVTIEWGAANISNGAYAMDVRYVDDNSGDTVAHRFPVKDSVSIIKNMGSVDSFYYRTVFIPDSLAIDTFYTDYQPYKVIPKTYKIDKSKWVATADYYADPYYAENAIDDNINTFWNTPWKDNPPPFPHWLKVDMQQSVSVVKLELTARQDYVLGFDFIIQGSDDDVNWQDYGSYTLLTQKESQEFNVIGRPSMRYIRIYQTNPSDPVPQSCLAELTVIGTL